VDGDSAEIDLQGVTRKANVSLIDDPHPGDYVLLHAGFAIERLSEQDLAAYREILGDFEAAPSGGTGNDG
jgi:hydrogenase expression/formation protein HypC